MFFVMAVLAINASAPVQDRGDRCFQVMVGVEDGGPPAPGQRCQRPDGSSYLVRGSNAAELALLALEPATPHEADTDQFQARAEAPIDRYAAATTDEQPPIPVATQTREQVVSTLQGRPYDEVVAQQAAAARAPIRSASAGARSPAPASTSRSAEIKAGLLTAWLNTPRFMPAIRMGMVRSDGTTILLDMAIMAEAYRVEVAPGATCAQQRGGALRCSYRMQFSGGASLLGSSPMWNPWGWVQRTDVFRSEGGVLRSAEMERFVLTNYGYRNESGGNACPTCTQDEMTRRREADWELNNAWRDWSNVGRQ